MDALHATLVRWRRAAKMTQQEAIERLGISRQYMSGIENGKYRPASELLIRMAHLYGVKASIPELLEMKVQPKTGLTADEEDLLRSIRKRDVDKTMKIVAEMLYRTDAA